MVEEFEDVACQICGNEQLEVISKVGQFGLPCNVVICPHDGLVFLSPRWRSEGYVDFYENEYDLYYRRKILDNESEDEKYHNIIKICERMENKNLLKGKSSVLDVGAGMGWPLLFLKNNYKQFKKFAAIEQSKYCVNNM